MIDLRSLNETVAGQSGFVKLSPDGNSFVLGDGTPARFWAIGSLAFQNQTPEDLNRHVRFLARMGVNMVRLHAQICPVGPDSRLTDVNETEIDGIWRFVAEAKKQGIYVTISPYWAHATDSAHWGIPGNDAAGPLYGLLFFDETSPARLQGVGLGTLRPEEPLHEDSLANDPAVAIIQIQNEDSLLFWLTDTLKPIQKAALGRKIRRLAGREVWLSRKGE